MTDASLAPTNSTFAGASPTIAAVGGWALALGSLSVVFTSLFYVLSPVAAVAPVLHAPPGAAAAAAVGAATMRIAGTSGVFGNLVMAVGTLLLAIERAGARRPVAAAGWAAILMSIIVFEIVDCLVGFVLSSTATGADGASTFAAFRTIFAVYFLVGTVLFGVGGLLALTRTTTKNGWINLVTWLGRLNGAMGVTAGLSTFAGLSVMSQIAGASVGLGAVVFAMLGFAAARDRLYDAP